MAEPQTTPQEGETSHLLEASAIEQANRNEAEQLEAHIATLRHKIEEDPLRPTYILTEPGVGYRFV